MCPCSPQDVSIPIPDAPSGPAIPGLGIPFSLNVKSINVFPSGVPEDILDFFSKIQLLIPPGSLKPNLSPNYGKSIFDAILKVLDQFMPFLMLYKFFLPLLNLVICIIEILCAFPNPEKIINALIKLFRNCIPEFLNLFPIFALIIMIISLLLLVIELIAYLVDQILKLVELFLTNILALQKALEYADATAILAIANKLGATLCIFQNFFVLLEIFSIVFKVIKDIASIIVSIPPCSNSAPDGCCTSDVCPEIVRNEYTRVTGNMQYFNALSSNNPIAGLPAPYNTLDISIRDESWQLFDPQQTVPQKFINIVDAYDIPVSPASQVLAALGVPVKPIFFPTDVTYTNLTPYQQAAYTVDLRLFYDPAFWGRSDLPRYVRVKNCIVVKAPTIKLNDYDNSTTNVTSGVFNLTGGIVYEDDGYTVITGYASDGVTPIASAGTLNNFFHLPTVFGSNPTPSPTDGYLFSDIEYTFKPNIPVLVGKGLITAGCAPELSINKEFINSVFAGDVTVNLQLLNDLLNGPNFPDFAATQECLNTAIVNLRNNLTVPGVAAFQATTQVCLDNLRNDAITSLNSAIQLAVDPCKSTFVIDPALQFTSKSIKVSVDLKESNGASLSVGLPPEVSSTLASKIKGHATLGEVSKFSYDGYQLFVADLSSKEEGDGELMVSFDNNMFCINNIPADINVEPTREIQKLNYQFIFAPVVSVPVGEGDTSTGKPRFDVSDLTRNGGRD